MRRSDFFRGLGSRLRGGFCDEGDHEEFECFGYGEKGGLAGDFFFWEGGERGSGLTDCRGRHLRYLAHVLVCLHDALYARDGKLGLDLDALLDAGCRLAAVVDLDLLLLWLPAALCGLGRPRVVHVRVRLAGF